MAINPKYDPQTIYQKFQTGCGNPDHDSDCGCGSSEDCSCCPVGTVAVYDCNGNHAGCLTPNDADAYNNSQVEIPAGYVKVFHPITGDYVALLTPTDAVTYLTFLNTPTE